VLLLQHPHERRKYYSSAKLLQRGLTNSRLLRGIEFEADFLNRILSGQRPYLLYPAKNALDCETVELKEDCTVIVLDGTWIEARKILFRNPLLKQFPAVSFSRALRSNYRIRKQPKDHYLSTLESVTYLLKLNAEAFGKGQLASRYDSLFEGFSMMVEKQLSYFPRNLKRAGHNLPPDLELAI